VASFRSPSSLVFRVGLPALVSLALAGYAGGFYSVFEDVSRLRARVSARVGWLGMLEGAEGPAEVRKVQAAARAEPNTIGEDAAALDAPVAFYRLLEDHSVGTAGNLLIDANFAEVPGPAWEIDLADGGHWSPSDLVGVVEDFQPGCGEDTREAGGAAFTYPDPARARAVSGAAAAAFFATTLLDDPAGAVWLASPPPELVVSSR